MNAIFKKVFYLIRKWIEKKAATIDSHQVIKDIYLDLETNPGYFLVLTLANLIALSGLITNSAPVIIGSMLISPLMGPILSIGFAFITGDKFVWERAAKKIALSVVLTIAVAAVATYFSPLKDITHEIASRTRPNLYDLAIAFFSGLAGAVAICTKKNYLTIVPGVAIATAVIPPLSVAGFGLGTGDFKILAGGFFLFFTNLVAIIISTVIVFYFYGFKPSLISEADISNLKKRSAALAVVLIIISIPLIYTLQESISEVTLRNNIQSVLKKALNKKDKTNLTTFSYAKEKDGELLINAVVNTVTYMTETETNAAEKNIKHALNNNAKLYLKQIKVQPGGLKEEEVKPIIPSVAPLKTQSDIIETARDNAVFVIRQISQKVDKIISPSTVVNFNVIFNDKMRNVSIVMTVKRDTPFSEEEVAWLKRMIYSKIKLPVDLRVNTEPFVPPLVFKIGETALSDSMKKSLISIRQVYIRDNSISVFIEAYTGSVFYSRRKLSSAEERIHAITDILAKDYKIPMEKIKTVVYNSKKSEAPCVRITIHQSGKLTGDENNKQIMQ